MPRDVFEPHPVVRDFTHAGLRDVGRHIGRQVGRRIVQFVEQLLLHRARVDAPARAVGLGDRAMAVGVDLGDGITHMREIGHFLEAGIGKVAPRHLRAAFEQMAGHGGARQLRPILHRPAEMRDRRAQHQGGVGHTAADHDVSTGAQRLGDRCRADIGVHTHDALLGQLLAQRLHEHGAVFVAP